MEYKLFIGGKWVEGGEPLEVLNKYTLETIGVLPVARQEEVDAAIAASKEAAPQMAEMTAYRRSQILGRAAALLLERKEDLARTIAAEAGKALKFAEDVDSKGISESSRVDDGDGLDDAQFDQAFDAVMDGAFGDAQFSRDVSAGSTCITVKQRDKGFIQPV